MHGAEASHARRGTRRSRNGATTTGRPPLRTGARGWISRARPCVLRRVEAVLRPPPHREALPARTKRVLLVSPVAHREVRSASDKDDAFRARSEFVRRASTKRLGQRNEGARRGDDAWPQEDEGGWRRRRRPRADDECYGKSS